FALLASFMSATSSECSGFNDVDSADAVNEIDQSAIVDGHVVGGHTVSAVRRIRQKMTPERSQSAPAAARRSRSRSVLGGARPDTRRKDQAPRSGGSRPQASPFAARSPRAATRPPRRREAWLRIFVVRCSLPCDPPIGGHSCNGRMIPRFHRGVCDHFTLKAPCGGADCLVNPEIPCHSWTVRASFGKTVFLTSSMVVPA